MEKTLASTSIASIKSRRKRRKRQVMFEAHEEWVAWVDSFAQTVGMSRSQLLDQAVRRYAMFCKYTSLPPMR